jgi:serine/threonine protein kinase
LAAADEPLSAAESRPPRPAADALTGLTEILGLGPVSPAHDPLPGRTLGDVTLERLIAEGGMGRVYLGRQDKPRRLVAVKVMRPGCISREVCRRFENESDILGRLRHPYIAQVYSAGVCNVVGAQVPYFIMEYIADALPLTVYAKQHALGIGQRLELFRKVCEAVAHGHEQGVIHRDLKPSNLLVEPSGVPKIIDFGVARCAEASQEPLTTLTDMGQLVGTVQYMSPEHFASGPREIGPASDVYALGVILYELIAGQPPYEISPQRIFDAAEVIRKHEPVPLSRLDGSLGRGLEQLASRCLEKDRDRRYANAGELASALRACIDGTRTDGSPWPPRSPTDRFPWPSRAALGWLAVLLLSGILIAMSGSGSGLLEWLTQSVERLRPTVPRVGINVAAIGIPLEIPDAPVKTELQERVEIGDTIEVADLNGDGVLDLVCSLNRSYSGIQVPGVYLLFGKGDQAFQAPAIPLASDGAEVSFGVTAGARVGDLTGDGVVDIAVLSGRPLPTEITVFEGLGNGRFRSWHSLTLARHAADIVLLDATGDGQLDIAAILPEARTIAVYPRDEHGFGPVVETSTGGWAPQVIGKARLNGDHLDDLIVIAMDAAVDKAAARVLAFHARSSGAMSLESPLVSSIPAPGGRLSLAIGDVNGDGRDDIALASGSSDRTGVDGVRIYLNDGSGAFSEAAHADITVPDCGPVSHPDDDFPTGVAIADFNQDGRADLFVTQDGSETSLFYLQTADGTFGEPQASNRAGWGAVVADINGDGNPDVLTARQCFQDVLTGRISFPELQLFIVTRQAP